MNEELYNQSVKYLEWIEENRDEWIETKFAPILEEMYEVLELLVDRLEKSV